MAPFTIKKPWNPRAAVSSSLGLISSAYSQCSNWNANRDFCCQQFSWMRQQVKQDPTDQRTFYSFQTLLEYHMTDVLQITIINMMGPSASSSTIICESYVWSSGNKKIIRFLFLLRKPNLGEGVPHSITSTFGNLLLSRHICRSHFHFNDQYCPDCSLTVRNCSYEQVGRIWRELRRSNPSLLPQFEKMLTSIANEIRTARTEYENMESVIQT